MVHGEQQTDRVALRAHETLGNHHNERMCQVPLEKKADPIAAGTAFVRGVR